VTEEEEEEELWGCPKAVRFTPVALLRVAIVRGSMERPALPADSKVAVIKSVAREEEVTGAWAFLSGSLSMPSLEE
jgi:hypothetical protein